MMQVYRCCDKDLEGMERFVDECVKLAKLSYDINKVPTLVEAAVNDLLKARRDMRRATKALFEAMMYSR